LAVTVAVAVLPAWSVATAVSVFWPSVTVAGTLSVPAAATGIDAPLSVSDATPPLSDAETRVTRIS
jgi:hypothetical protein